MINNIWKIKIKINLNYNKWNMAGKKKGGNKGGNEPAPKQAVNQQGQGNQKQ